MTVKLNEYKKNMLRASELYREYFVDVRKFNPFPVTVTQDNVQDFVYWLIIHKKLEAREV